MHEAWGSGPSTKTTKGTQAQLLRQQQLYRQGGNPRSRVLLGKQGLFRVCPAKLKPSRRAVSWSLATFPRAWKRQLAAKVERNVQRASEFSQQHLWA